MADNGGKPATKSDLQTVRSELKSDLQTVRSELKEDVKRLAIELVKTQADVREIKQTMATKEDVGRILNAIDSFAKKAVSYDRAAALHGHALTELQVGQKDHEKRLKSIESARS